CLSPTLLNDFRRFYIHRSPALSSSLLVFFFFNDSATSEIYTLSLHDALPIFAFENWMGLLPKLCLRGVADPASSVNRRCRISHRSEEHTSELQSLAYLVCRLLLEKKKIIELLLAKGVSDG